MLVQGYKYVSIAREEDEAKKNIFCFVIVFSYHCLQLGAEMAIIFFIVHNFLLSGMSYRKVKMRSC